MLLHTSFNPLVISRKNNNNLIFNKIDMFTQKEIDLIKKIQESLHGHNGEYTVTLLFNWMGVLFLPQSRWLKKLPTSTIDHENWGIGPDNVLVYEDEKRAKNDLSVKNVAKHLHNSVVHYWVQYLPTSGEVEILIFRDWKNEALTFEMLVSVRCFRRFLMNFAQKIMADSTHP